jgi:hypothetical protein
VDYRKTTGTYYVEDVYAGPGLAGVPRGSIKKLRVVALDFRAAGIGNNGSSGPGGAALISTPIAIGNGSWDVKIILGDAEVHEDGSCLFEVPARTPVYFQAIDDRGFAVQTMRSWSTLQPGEFASCVGCHEHKNTTPPTPGALSRALAQPVRPLTPFYGPPRGFSFAREIQPVLDRHCVSCHQEREPLLARLANPKASPLLESLNHGDGAWVRTPAHTNRAFSLLGTPVEDRTAKRWWSDSYLALTEARPSQADHAAQSFYGNPRGRWVNWIGSQSVPEPLPPYFAGAAHSQLMTLLMAGHRGVKLTREEIEKVACWIDLLVPFCGDYREANAWAPDEKQKYEHYAGKRQAYAEEEKRSLEAWIAALATSDRR